MLSDRVKNTLWTLDERTTLRILENGTFELLQKEQRIVLSKYQLRVLIKQLKDLLQE